MTKDTDEYATPWDVVRALEARYGHFDLDPCATAATTKAERHFDKEINGLAKWWNNFGTRVFVNPPYSRQGSWVAKCALEGVDTEVVALLLPSTDAAWWHDYVMGEEAGGAAREVIFIRGRIAFELDGVPQPNNARGSVIVQWRPRHKGPTAYLSWDLKGAVR